jgi:hypothetical protein
MTALRLKVGALITALLAISLSCASRRPLGPFRVLSANPDYLLRSPDAKDTPFPEVLHGYNSFVYGKGSIDLRPQMELRIENAYYRKGSSRRGLEGYLGTEIAKYQVRPKSGLRLVSAQSGLTKRPLDQPPVQDLIPASQRSHRLYRFFYAVVFKKIGETRGSVLLGAGSTDQLDRLAAQLLSDPDSICGGQSLRCTVFPGSSAVSLEIEIIVNGTSQTVPWGSLLSSVAARPRHVDLLRLHAGKPTLVEIDSTDTNALRLPLLPGDKINWN